MDQLPVSNECFVYICWRAVARQPSILYNSEIWPKSVGCKIVDLRSRMLSLYPGVCGFGDMRTRFLYISGRTVYFSLSRGRQDIPYWYLISRVLNFAILARQYFAGFYFRDFNWQIWKKGIKFRDWSVLNFILFFQRSELFKVSR